MESVPKGLATKPVECTTSHESEMIDDGTLQLEAGHSLRGKIVLRDSASIPDGMRVIISSDNAWDSQLVPLRSNGTFECSGLPTGSYDINPAVRGYRPLEPFRHMFIDHDIDELDIVLEPESRPKN